MRRLLKMPPKPLLTNILSDICQGYLCSIVFFLRNACRRITAAGQFAQNPKPLKSWLDRTLCQGCPVRDLKCHTVIAPRLILPYIAGQAVRGSRKVILGKKMRQFLRKLGISPGSNNYRTILQQFINLATCQIVVSNVTDRNEDRQEAWVETDIYGITRKIRYQQPLSVFTDATASGTVGTAVGCGLRYQEFMEGKTRFTLSRDFYDFVRIRPTPVRYQHLLKFVRSPRRMDLYVWLSHRTYRIRPSGVKIRLDALHRQFAPDIDPNSRKLFRQRLRGDLDAILAVHPGFNVQLTRDALLLFDSEPPVPRLPGK